ncbi:EscU/YscU/HrcU family type III secretion system export apparatus switch protein [Jeotgalibacillus haloalkalitolerans]|uniref:EscU/YscU/HrcU family type III secretion system export apparatus switch protein n=1 Tax=Jeotgalibacillus haloalkalitolerans TaxID=3104292 RepID=A0ABU5KKP9_9BACL|nr:EscU/YscU/HrcU family type III secretion system export apparatus switch protein [Jeotgalibacillus sp. HH7-29]MDZ5711704.1 EscU/YscU/HrcU family type III secretion system export apparatus switch protein [Jeotgalibacillus sp. HH7-29]
MKQHKRLEAVALTYTNDSPAPVVSAKGKGKIAESIIEQAKAHHVPIQQDESLVELLGQLDLNETIPDELYQAVAEVFAFIYRLDREKK